MTAASFAALPQRREPILRPRGTRLYGPPLAQARRLLPAVLLLLAAVPALADAPAKCPIGRHLLWGDGVHDDTAALNAWFQGETVAWGETREPVGDAIEGRVFLLSNVVYVPAGTGRSLTHFRMVWPRRPETVTGDALRTGGDPDKEPVSVNIKIVGGDPDEGVAFEAPDPDPHGKARHDNCLIS